MKIQSKALIALAAAAGVGAATLAAGAQTPPAPQGAMTPAPRQTNNPAMGPGAQPYPNSMPSPGAANQGVPPAGGSTINVPNPPAMPLPTSDAQFVRMAALMNNAEIMEARLAARRTKSPLVQQFAQRMIDDHTTAAVELDAASRKAEARYRVPGRAEMPDSRAEYMQLEQASGPQFDQMYIADQVPDHTAAINAFEWEAQNGKDPVIKDFAVRQLPAIKNHLAMANAYVASNGTSLTVDAGGLSVGAGGAGATGTNPTPKTANRTPANNPATTSNGQQNQTNNLNAGTPTQGSPAPSASPRP